MVYMLIVRKAHNSGRNHVQNVIDYYNGSSVSSLQTYLCLCLSFKVYPCKLGLGHNQAQNIIDQITRQYEGGGMGGPPGMGVGMGMGGPVMRNAGPPPFMNGGPPGKLYPLMPLEPVSTKGD
jgi:U1 small nuclear ribonucleoprotein C